MATILLVDDNPQQLQALQDVLEALDHTVQTAANGTEALEALCRHLPPDMILSDILMPQMDGFTLCRTVKQDPKLADIPFAFLTGAYIDPEDREFGLRLGAARFITRPIQMAELATILCEMLEHCQDEAVPAGTLAIDDQEEYLQQYSAAVVRRLEDQVAALEAANRALQHEIEERRRAEEALRSSEHSLRTLIEQAPVAMAVSAGAEQTGVMVNARFTELFGYDICDLPTLQEWWLLAYPDPDYREHVRIEWAQRAQPAIENAGQIAPMEAHVTCKDGSRRHIQFFLSSIGDLHIVSFIDLTAQKNIEEALRKAEHEKALVLNSMSDVVVYQSCDMRIIWANQAAAASVGTTSEDMVGQQCHAFWGQRSEPCVGCPVIRALETGHSQEGEIINPDGRIWMVRGFPVLNEQGDLEGVVEYASDITERKWVEQRQMELALEQERAGILLRFIGDASHDLRTPLTTIKTHLYLLGKVNLAGDAVRYVEEINRQTDRLEKLLDDMLSVSRLDATTEFDRHCMDLNALVRSVVDQYQPLAREKQHTLDFMGTPDLPLMMVDQTHLRRAVSNLLVNALHYTADGGRITVRTDVHDTGICVEVIDNGFGIGADDLPHIFKRFYRADKARGTVRGGAGLGLTIAQKIVSEHEGFIEVDTEPGRGSTFRIVLPVGMCDE